MSETVILVCARVREGHGLLFTDNKVGVCELCRWSVEYRPHAPEPHTLRCVPCTRDLIEQMVEGAKTYFQKED
jgi:hypothetical protein